MKIVDMMLENYWILKEDDKDAYYYAKDNVSKVREFFSEKLGYQVIVNPTLIKLEKLPGALECWMGIDGFEDCMEYAFLCMLLMFLEDKPGGEQFLLSQLTEYIEGVFTGDGKVDWTLYRHRRFIIKVIKFALEMGMIRLNDGSESDFASDGAAEALYENTGISVYFMRQFTGNFMSYGGIEDIMGDEWSHMDTERGRIRRNRVYRRLVMSPAVYSEGGDDSDYEYIKNFKGVVQSDIEDRLSAQLHVHKNAAFVVLPQNKGYRGVFPQNSALSDIALQMNLIIREHVNEGVLKVSNDDVIRVSQYEFKGIVEKLKRRFVKGWSKEYRDMGFEKLYGSIVEYMKSFSMIRLEEYTGDVHIMPICGKIEGNYPEDFEKAAGENDGK
ncbi:TIGR02678 family protein [Peptoclostridium litorale DSM 5388]|uniref:TIGR02678 family protein n=1 Tax=Peptoclostridium litorale DSM 5388 TaxID=1121324 RepID=A0A069RD86_PEPLI|nr:TIGR02678 family protein [Peptoclostridium litorale]KDR95006.1 hypothetical protein CLIT_11c00330 [Peptoclostridium litorale DSM 5388]SIN76663.1 TIGR02678 family protein [Peptoclostridium litorale DSM 5388]